LTFVAAVGCGDGGSVIEQGTDALKQDGLDDDHGSSIDSDDTARVSNETQDMVHQSDVAVDWNPLYPECHHISHVTLGEAPLLKDVRRRFSPEPIRSAEEFEAQWGQPAPAEVAFPDEWVIVFPHYDWEMSYGTKTTIHSLEFCPEQMGAFCAQVTHSVPAEGCAALEYQRPGYSIIKMAAQPQEFSQFCLAEQTVQIECADVGASLGSACFRDTLCRPGAFCAGLTRADEGVCVPESSWRVVSNYDALSIPDGDLIGGESTNNVAGLPGVDADIRLKAYFGHPRPSDLRVTLRSPTGKEAVVLDQDATMQTLWRLQDVGFDFDFGGQNQVEGEWALHVSDGVLGNTGELRSWTLEIVSRDQ
jgi:subtilisin-like proprotein convertase family protein